MDAVTLMRRLGIIRYIHTNAVMESRKAGHPKLTAILGFHDAVEMFLVTMCDHLSAKTTPNIKFDEYFKVLSEPPAGKTLLHASQASRLNKIRVSLKHHCILPTESDIDDMRAASTSFLEDNCKAILAVDFATVSMIDQVADEEVRKYLNDAGILRDANDLREASYRVAVAFRKLLLNRHKKVWGNNDVNPFSFGGQIELFDVPQLVEGFQQSDFYYKVQGAIDSLQEAVTVLALGIDYHAFAKFRYLIPVAIPHSKGKEEGYNYQIRSKAPPLSTETIRFGIDFVVETALHLQRCEAPKS